ncbi:hypothetical protein [Amycolatopsis anabasis]|uniref:hypothetical protein n=1 Tax=Amycolatopsis anabasis TaxID=1840409 RepID=UPI00131E4661|nr:hypothetical protein [Amycolatopsis anabasis]
MSRAMLIGRPGWPPGKEVPRWTTNSARRKPRPPTGENPDFLRQMVDAGTGWRYFRAETGIRTRPRDGTLRSFQELSPGGERIGPQRLYLREREDCPASVSGWSGGSASRMWFLRDSGQVAGGRRRTFHGFVFPSARHGGTHTTPSRVGQCPMWTSH